MNQRTHGGYFDYNIKLFGVFTITIVDTSVTLNHNIKDDDNTTTTT